MKTIASVAALAAISLIDAVAAQQPTDNPLEGLKGLRTPVYVGCYSSSGGMTDMGEYTFQAMGWCQPLCVRQAKAVLAFTGGTNCLCGDSTPPSSAKIDDSHCQVQCQGYPQQKCGGDKAFAVYQDGYKAGDPTGNIRIVAPPQTSSADSAAPTDDAADADAGGGPSRVHASTVFVTQSGVVAPSVVSITATADADPAPAGPNKAAIAAGVVVAVVAVAAAVGGLVLFLRRKKQVALAEERRRMEEHTRLAAGPEKPPSTFSASDSRLEPSVMFQRRQSDGSIMDNQDYSRRILKVTNPDDR